METGNGTWSSVFVFWGLTQNKNLSLYLFALFFVVYLVTILGNAGLMILVYVSPSLYTPMYLFLSFLAAVDLLYSSTVTPKLLTDLISQEKTISFHGCAAQLFFFIGLAGTDSVLLSTMSYDRYVAICHPLHYTLIMTKKRCLTLVALSFYFGFLQSAAQTSCVFSLSYCGAYVIDHFLCDVPSMLRLSCSNTLHCSMVTVSCVVGYCLITLSAIFVSYGFILFNIFHIKSSEGRRRAFSTCSSHLTCSTLFFMTLFITYMCSPSNLLEKEDKMAAVFYSIVAPMVNPFIYSIRNQQVKTVLLQVIHIRC
ncbi:olfactory receptor 5AR1-like [Gastrophryne carolinensis]